MTEDEKIEKDWLLY